MQKICVLRYCLLGIFLLIVFSTIAQDHGPDMKQYIVRDSSFIMGTVIERKGGYEIEFRKTKKSKPEYLTARDIEEYAVNGQKFQSFSLNGKREFHRILSDGKTRLFKIDGRLAARVDTTLIYFNRGNYKSTLLERFKSPGRDQALHKVRYSKHSIVKYARLHARGRSNNDGIPHKKLGLYAGATLLSYQVSTKGSSIIEFQATNMALTGGLFGEFPLDGCLFLSVEANVFRDQFLMRTDGLVTTNLLRMNVAALQVMPGLKLQLSRQFTRPYIKAGYLASIIQTSSEDGILRINSSKNIVELTAEKIATARVNASGAYFGIGVERNLSKKKIVHLEAKYLFTTSAQLENYSTRYSGFNFTAGFSL